MIDDERKISIRQRHVLVLSWCQDRAAVIPCIARRRSMCTTVLARLDYCNGVLAGLPASQLSRLQSVLHAAARLIY